MRDKEKLGYFGSNRTFFGQKLRLFGKFTNKNFFGRKTELAADTTKNRYGEEMELFVNECDDLNHHDLESIQSKLESDDQFLMAIPIIALYFSIEFGKNQKNFIISQPFFSKRLGNCVYYPIFLKA